MDRRDMAGAGTGRRGPVRPRRLAFLPALVFLPATLPAQEVVPAGDPAVAAAFRFVEDLREGRYEAAAATVAPAVPAGALSAERLREIWTRLVGQAGPLEGIEPTRVTTAQDTLAVVDLAAGFQSRSLTIRVVLTPDRRVTGLWFLPPEPPPYEPPPYVDEGAFREVEVTVGEAPWELPGTLTLPRGGGPFPGLVLVHGSGPNDRDETIGPNRPFRDLAWGLAGRGIAVLRYDKRTRAHGARMGPEEATVETVVVEDALAALRLLRGRGEVDPERVFLLGHSLGGMLAPEIAARDGRVRGVALLAAPARPMSDVLLDQLDYLGSLGAAGSEVTLDSLRAAARALREGTLDPERTFLGAPGRFWLELQARDPVARAKALRIPILVLQGGRDYNATMEDFRLWEEALGGGAGATLRAFPDLNHLFAPGEGRATPAEYLSEQKHVDPRVIDAIARWIQGPGSG